MVTYQGLKEQGLEIKDWGFRLKIKVTGSTVKG
jgi:hypothetical protein